MYGIFTYMYHKNQPVMKVNLQSSYVRYGFGDFGVHHDLIRGLKNGLLAGKRTTFSQER